MTNEQILQQAIEKANSNRSPGAVRGGGYWNISEYQGYERHDIESLIFSHDFAKAFFGEELASSLNNPRLRNWQFHLTQMVLEENPLKYLEKFI